jgi:hypothetical protein
MARDDDDLRVHLALAQPGQRLEAVDAGQPDVEHDHVERRARGAGQARLAALDGLDLVALVAQHGPE